MVKEAEPVEIGDSYDAAALRKLVDEVRSTRTPRVLRQGTEELAVLSAARPPRKKRRRVQPVGPDDPIFRLVGSARSGIPGGVRARSTSTFGALWTTGSQ